MKNALFLFITIALVLASIVAVPVTSTDKSKDDLISNNVNPEIKDEYKPQTTSPPEVHHVKPGVAVARIIDDIFQIPIGVLQSVSKLLRNPFVQHNKTPETVSSY